MCTGTILSPYDLMVSRNSSSTGAQYCDWQRAGVANSAATGLPAPITVASDWVCSGHIGARVHIGSTPSVSVAVGDGSRGADSPGTTAAGLGFTAIVNGTFCPCARASTCQVPALSKSGRAT